MKRADLERYLNDRECLFFRHGGNHDIWMHRVTRLTTSMPRHREIKFTTVRAICKQLGVEPPQGK